MTITAADIFAKGEKRTKVVITQLDNLEVYVKELSNKDSEIFRGVYESDPSFTNVSLLIMCIVNENGERIFSVDDIEKVTELPRKAFDEMVSYALAHCGFFENMKTVAGN